MTGVQTCALPISSALRGREGREVRSQPQRTCLGVNDNLVAAVSVRVGEHLNGLDFCLKRALAAYIELGVQQAERPVRISQENPVVSVRSQRADVYGVQNSFGRVALEGLSRNRIDVVERAFLFLAPCTWDAKCNELGLPVARQVAVPQTGRRERLAHLPTPLYLRRGRDLDRTEVRPVVAKATGVGPVFRGSGSEEPLRRRIVVYVAEIRRGSNQCSNPLMTHLSALRIRVYPHAARLACGYTRIRRADRWVTSGLGHW